jgi:predicted dehydrogenase
VKPLRAAVIGVGYLGRFHALKYAAMPDVELVAVADIRETRAQEVARECRCRAARDFREILDAVDLVSVVVPTESHYEVARACLEAGRHVLVEKPLARSLSEADELIELAAAAGCVLQVGHLERFNPALAALREVVCDPLFIESYRLSTFRGRGTDVDVVLDLMIHDIDIVLHVVRSEITEVRPIGFPVITDGVDIAHARIDFANGCVANLNASRVSNKALRTLRVFQHDAYFSVDLHSPRVVHWCRVQGEGAVARLESTERAFPAPDLILAEVRAFVDAVRGGTPPPVTGKDGRRALEIALRISAPMIRSRADLRRAGP